MAMRNGNPVCYLLLILAPPRVKLIIISPLAGTPVLVSEQGKAPTAWLVYSD